MTGSEKQDGKGVVLLEGIELSTSPLPRECSTTELQQRSAHPLRTTPPQGQVGCLLTAYHIFVSDCIRKFDFTVGPLA